jgi:hypothetical protein
MESLQRMGVKTFVGLALFAAWVVGAQAATFKLYDSLIYAGKPDLTPYGVHKSKTVYERELCPPGDGFPSGRCVMEDGTWAPPKEERVKSVMQAAARDGNEIVVLDIECWPLQIFPDSKPIAGQPCLRKVPTIADISKFAGYYAKVATWAKEAAPTVSIGFYAVLVPHLGAYWANIRGGREYSDWEATAKRMSVLADKVDFVAPSVYTFFPDQEAWIKSTTGILRTARRLYPGKPIIPFIWPQYHEGSAAAIRGTPLSGDYWATELKLLYQLADGAIMWGGYKTDWEDSAAWWQETKRFAASHR